LETHPEVYNIVVKRVELAGDVAGTVTCYLLQFRLQPHDGAGDVMWFQKREPEILAKSDGHLGVNRLFAGAKERRETVFRFQLGEEALTKVEAAKMGKEKA